MQNKTALRHCAVQHSTSTRSGIRRRALFLLLLLLLLVAISCVSLALNTQRAVRHVLINSRQHFHEAIELGSTPPAAAITTRSISRQQQQRQQYNASRQIPRILHVNYMSGPEQLLKDALKPLSHFRKEWWLSCKAHHPSWTHLFWDKAACEQLLQSSYPRFLDTWQALNSSVVLKSGEGPIPASLPLSHGMPSLLRLPPACSLPPTAVGASRCCKRHPPVHPAQVWRRVHRP